MATVKLSPEALSGDLNRLVYEAQQAGWELKLKFRTSDSSAYSDLVFIRLVQQETMNDERPFLTDSGEMIEHRSGWDCHNKQQVVVWGTTVFEAIGELPAALEAVQKLQDNVE